MDAKHEEIIRKVQKLFRLAEKAGTDAEAQAAAIRAREIMAQYNISLSDAESFSEEDCHEETLIIKANYLPRHVHTLAGAIQALFGVEALIGKKLELAKGKRLRRKTVTFVGVGADAIIARQAYEFLLEYALRRAREMRLTGARKNDFLYGFALALDHRAVQESKKTADSPQEMALVPVRKGTLDNYLARKYPNLTESKNRYVYSFTDDARSGYAIGKNVSLDRPVQEHSSGSHIALN